MYPPALQHFISDEPSPVLRVVRTTVLCLSEMFPRFLLGPLTALALGDALCYSPPLSHTQLLGP